MICLCVQVYILCVYLYIYVYTYIHMYIYTGIHIYIHMYIYIYIFVHLRRASRHCLFDSCAILGETGGGERGREEGKEGKGEKECVREGEGAVQFSKVRTTVMIYAKLSNELTFEIICARRCQIDSHTILVKICENQRVKQIEGIQ